MEESLDLSFDRLRMMMMMMMMLIVALCSQTVLRSVCMGPVTVKTLQCHYNLSIFTRAMISSHFVCNDMFVGRRRRCSSGEAVD